MAIHNCEIEVWGDFACFSRPEMKVERVSYDVMTPSAARGIFEAILWKPQIRWQITSIAILAPIQWTTIRRNEVTEKASARSGYLVSDENRAQRSSTLLKDVRYQIRGYPVLTNKAGAEDSKIKYIEMFRRRVSKGQYYHQPYLGCREFACFFSLVSEARPIDETKDLAFMLYDIEHLEDGSYRPLFFRAALEKGILLVPELNSAEVLR